MKLIVLHGDNLEKISNRLLVFIGEAKKRGWDIKRISDANESLAAQMTKESLFGETSLYIWEKYSKLNKKDISWLKNKTQELDATLVIYNEGLIHATSLKSLPDPKNIEEYKLPKLIWKFLDSFYPGNSREVMELLHELDKNEEIIFVFALLARHIRDLIWVKKSPDTLDYASWRLSKLKNQSNKYNNGMLNELLNDFAKADVASKTSKNNLLDSLDFIIATRLE